MLDLCGFIAYGWGRLKPTGKNLYTPPRLFSTTTPRNFKCLLKHARTYSIVGAINAGLKRKRDVEGGNWGCSGSVLCEQHKIMSVEVSAVNKH